MDRDETERSRDELPELPPYEFRGVSDMQWEKQLYDAELDLASEYEASVIEQGIRDQVEERARDYLSKNGDAVWARIARSVGDAEALVDTHPGASLVLSMTAVELLVRFLLLRPMLAGLVIDPSLADRLAAEATKAFGGRDRELLPHLCHAWGLDLDSVRLGQTQELWPTLGMLSKARDRAVHRADVVEAADAKLALSCLVALSQKVLVQLAGQLSMKWPQGKWLMPFDEAADPLARS